MVAGNKFRELRYIAAVMMLGELLDVGSGKGWVAAGNDWKGWQ